MLMKCATDFFIFMYHGPILSNKKKKKERKATTKHTKHVAYYLEEGTLKRKSRDLEIYSICSI